MVPDFPSSTAWTALLHWCLRVMDDDDPDVAFIASLLSHAHLKGGLTDRQGKYAQRTISRLHALWQRGELTAQMLHDDATWLATTPTEGRA